MMRRQAFSLIELLIVVAFGGIALGYIANSWKSSRYLNKVVADDNSLQLIEEDIRSSVLDLDLMELAALKNSDLNDCMTENDILCKSLPIKNITLFNGRNIPVTGSFYEWGKPCSSGSCPIIVEADAIPRCQDNSPQCEKAVFVNITYRIMLRATNSTFMNDGNRIVHRKNTLRAVISDQAFADTSSACDLVDGRPTFASSIVNGVIEQSNCRLPPGRSRTAENIIPGKCKVREVLVGINVDGSIKCAPAY